MAGIIVGVILLCGILTGCGFYFIPKYAMSTTNGWITAIDSAIGWIGANWIVFTIIAVLALICIIATVLLVKKSR